VQIGLPTDVLALSVINEYNTVVDGAEFRKDGYVYLDGEQADKWFYSFKGHKLWAGLSEEDLPRVEKVYHRARQRAKRVWNGCHARIVELITSTDSPVCHLPDGNNQNEWRVWRYHPEDNTFSKTWCSEGMPTNVEVGIEVAELEKRMYGAGRWASFVLDILNHFVSRILPHPTDTDESLAVVVMNGRSYYYAKSDPGGVSGWSLLAHQDEVISSIVSR